MKKIAIINQRYGLEVNGGSELYSRQIAERLKAKYEVEVLTSCAVEYVKWQNYYKEGVEDINGVTVRRFKTVHERIPKVFSALDSEMLSNPNAGEELSDRWIEHMGPYCPELVEYVDEHQDEYEAIIVVTYLFYFTSYQEFASDVSTLRGTDNFAAFSIQSCKISFTFCFIFSLHSIISSS